MSKAKKISEADLKQMNDILAQSQAIEQRILALQATHQLVAEKREIMVELFRERYSLTDGDQVTPEGVIQRTMPAVEAVPTAEVVDPPKRKRGRPRKNNKPEATA